MATTSISINITEKEKIKVAYALNLCAVSITQIIDSKDIIVLRQEREFILGNLNLQNFVKHPALLDVIKQILNAITYFEIEAGDLSFIEQEYQQKLKNAIWTAVPTPNAFFLGGDPVSTALAIAAQIGTGYMNYRRNKHQYLIDKKKDEWELRKHEIEQLNGLRSLLFETAWKLSSDYDFDDKFRLTERQVNRYSAALLESDPLRRYERLDVISDKFAAFPPFWYHKGNAAMEVFRDKRYESFAVGYKEKAITSYNEFHKRNFEFLREDIIAASCCLEHISLLERNDVFVETLLQQAMRSAGDNYDVLQQSIFVNLQLGRLNEVVMPLREMIVNDYNVALNGSLLSRIYFNQSNRIEYEKLRIMIGQDNVSPWSDDADKHLIDARRRELSEEYCEMARQIIFKLNVSQSIDESNKIYRNFLNTSSAILKYCGDNKELLIDFKNAESKLKEAIIHKDDKTKREFFTSVEQLSTKLLEVEFSFQIVEENFNIIEQMKQVIDI